MSNSLYALVLLTFSYLSLMSMGCSSEVDADLLLMRETYTLPQDSEGNSIRASTPRACGAAARIFRRIDFTGMTKEQVLRLLGDPETISDYGHKAEMGDDDPLL